MSKRKEIPDVMSQLQGLGSTTPPEVEEEPLSRSTLVPPPSREGRRPPQRTNRAVKRRLMGRATYDIGKDLKDAIHRESVDLGVPASQLAKYLLLYAWDFYLNGDIPEPPTSRSDSPRFRNTIDFAE